MTIGQLYTLGVHPFISPFAVKFLLRVMSEHDLTKPRAFSVEQLRGLYMRDRPTPKEIRKALKELIEAGVLEEIGQVRNTRTTFLPLICLRAGAKSGPVYWQAKEEAAGVGVAGE